MKNILLTLLVVFSQPLFCNSQVGKIYSIAIQEYKKSKIENISGKIQFDTLYKENGFIISAIDSLDLDPREGGPLLFYVNDKESILSYLGRFRGMGMGPVGYKIIKFSNGDKFIEVDVFQSLQGISETMLYFFEVKENQNIANNVLTIFDAGLDNAGLCPDIQKCFSYITTLQEYTPGQLIFIKVGTMLDYKKNKLIEVNEKIKFLKEKDGKWIRDKKE